jgi:hypothetical protein
MKMDKVKGIVEADQHCFQQRLHGNLANRDTVLQIG